MNGRESSRNAQKKLPETLWKLVDAKCAQLKDVVSSARLALFALLAWTFALFIALYNHEVGYTGILLNRYEKALIRVEHGEDACDVIFGLGNDARKVVRSIQEVASWVARYHNEIQKDLKLSTKDGAVLKPSKLCNTILKTQHEELLKEQIHSWHITIPTLGGNLFVFDIGVAGQVGMIMLLLWFFFATRRENHAIRSFVDIPQSDAARYRWRPTTFVLTPKDKFLSAEHYCFAYHAVAQRFMFIFSSQVGPLLTLTILFIHLPLIVCIWNGMTDVRDFFELNLTSITASKAHTVLSVLMLLVVGTLSWASARYTIQTSILLNGWYLAARDVWADDWDEGNDDPAPDVKVFRENQVAERTIRESPVAPLRSNRWPWILSFLRR